MAGEMYVWPDWMPCFLVSGYGLQVVDRRVSTDMDVGGNKRVEFDTDECTANCSVSCNNEQADFFEVFERDLLCQGTRWFQARLWVGGRMKTQTVRFKTRPQITGRAGWNTNYAFSLDIAKRDGLMSSEIAGLLTVYYPLETITPTLNLLEKLVNVDLPKVR